MQAKKKPIEKIAVAELGLELSRRSRLIKVYDGEVKKQCKQLASIDELINVIKAGQEA
jgi:electron transfer flavoprotein alpha/beta subunit